jgi:hypothetical protein
VVEYLRVFRHVGFFCWSLVSPDKCLAAGWVAVLRITFVKTYLFHIVLAICLVSGTWCASHLGLHPTTEATANQAAPVASIAEDDVMDLRTGDTFWGFHLTGVVPCSKLLVKGAGNLVTLSLRDDGDARCVYHVMDEKRIELQGKEFRLRVIGPDQIHVERQPISNTVAISR